MAVVVFISRVFPIVRFSILSFVDYVPESCEAVSSLFDLTEAQSFPGHELSKAEYITANSHGITSPIERERSTPTPTSALISAPPLTPLTSPSPSSRFALRPNSNSHYALNFFLARTCHLEAKIAEGKAIIEKISKLKYEMIFEEYLVQGTLALYAECESSLTKSVHSEADWNISPPPAPTCPPPSADVICTPYTLIFLGNLLTISSGNSSIYIVSYGHTSSKPPIGETMIPSMLRN
ncbi:hypothetical protein F5051DRAFT_445523 [Lentinula edodes]|nr:hypothetical protein F5051DRAFT_445523 [Lentinula edodes]